jgi:hypothetical protein
MDRVDGSWTSVGAAHGGHRTEAAVVAHQSSCSRPLWATVDRHEVGKTKSTGVWFRPSPEIVRQQEVARRRWSFGSGWRRRGRDEDQEEES